jgi:hypothetical protein
MCFEELLLLINSSVQKRENIEKRLLIEDLCLSICCQYLLHDLIQEVVAELSLCDSP